MLRGLQAHQERKAQRVTQDQRAIRGSQVRKVLQDLRVPLAPLVLKDREALLGNEGQRGSKAQQAREALLVLLVLLVRRVNEANKALLALLGNKG